MTTCCLCSEVPLSPLKTLLANQPSPHQFTGFSCSQGLAFCGSLPLAHLTCPGMSESPLPCTHINYNPDLILPYFQWTEISEKKGSWILGGILPESGFNSWRLLAEEGELHAARCCPSGLICPPKPLWSLLQRWPQHPLQTTIWSQPGLEHQGSRTRRGEGPCLAQLFLWCPNLIRAAFLGIKHCFVQISL